MVTTSISQYEEIVGREEVDEIKEIASRVKGVSVIHVNSTKFGGGVAELLKSIVPLAKSLGLNVSWMTIKGSPDFFKVTKIFHNALQGMPLKLTDHMKEVYLKHNRVNAEKLKFNSDIVIIHDPQPAALASSCKHDRIKWVWRCHLDITNPNPDFWNFIKPLLNNYDAHIFSLDKYIKKDIGSKRIFIIQPSIDPLTDKNRTLTDSYITAILEKYDIDPERPIITQVGRFDPWKDPTGVIDVYRLVKNKMSETQLILVGSFAHDDPEGKEWYIKTKRKASNDSSIHILTDKDDLEVNAIQRASNVVVQKSIREGFGITVAEALWKGVPVVATRAGGIPLQVINGVTGYLVEGSEEMAARVIQLIKRPYLNRILGCEGKNHIERNFLITRHLKDYLKIHLEMCE